MKDEMTVPTSNCDVESIMFGKESCNEHPCGEGKQIKSLSYLKKSKNNQIFFILIINYILSLDEVIPVTPDKAKPLPNESEEEEECEDEEEGDFVTIMSPETVS